MKEKNIKKLVEEVGIENIIVVYKTQRLNNLLGIISYTSSNDPYIEIPHTIIEDRYEVNKGYKITLKPMIEGLFSISHLYQSDFNQMWKENHIVVYVRY